MYIARVPFILEFGTFMDFISFVRFIIELGLED